MADQHSAAGVREGDILAGKYRIDKILGVGGMGVVVAAHHIQLDDKVAIKFLLPDALLNRDAVSRFAREARAAVKIKSEHVARVIDVGTLENGAPYMVMEHLDGSDLSSWLETRGAMSVEQAAEFVLQACEALAEAHALGIVHRDLKPANLFVIRRPDGGLSVKVLDFGISKMTGLGGSASDNMTRTSAIMGSPLYMSPEQMRSSKDADARSDIWSLGIILYELLAAESPFLADTMPELVLQIVSSPPPPLRNKRPDAPPGIEQIILKCLDKDRGRRYQNVAELAVALLDFAPKRGKVSVERIAGVMKAAGLAGTALVLPPSSEPFSQSAEGRTAASWGSTGQSSTGGRTAVVAGLLAVVAIVIVIAGILMMRKSPDASSVPSASAIVAAAAEPLPPASSALPAELPRPEPMPIASASPPVVRPTPQLEAAPISAVQPAKSRIARKEGTVSKPSAVSPPPAASPFLPSPAPASPARKPSNAFDDRK